MCGNEMIEKFFHFLLDPFLYIIRKSRKKFYTFKVKIRAASYQEPITVNGNTIVSRNTRLGKNVSFNGTMIFGNGKVVIGDNFHSGIDVWIFTENHDYDHGNAVPYDSAKNVVKTVTIEDNVWLGSRVTILGGVTIGEGAIIQAGAVVVSDIPKYGVAGGNPAKVFKYRNVEHYEKLKAEGKFH